MKHNAGFTFAEMLVVLCIVGVMIGMTTLLPTAHWQSEVEERIFFEQLRHEMNYAQEVAIIDNVAVTVIFDEEYDEVRVVDAQRNVVNRVLALPEEWQLLTSFEFSYLPNGHITYFKTIEFANRLTGSTRKIVMQLGSGKFDIK